jgi:hypothetical protein
MINQQEKEKDRGKCIIPVEQGLILHHFLPDQNTITVQKTLNQYA